MIIRDKEQFKEYVDKLEFTFAKTYANFAPHEYVVTNEPGEKLQIIQSLNRYIQEHYDETEIFAKKEYQVLFLDKHKYWNIEDWNITNILNRNWDYKNEDGTTNTSVTQSYLTNRRNDKI